MRIKSTLVTIASLSVLVACGYGIYAALHSPLFVVRVVEVADLPEQAPLDAQTVSTLAAVPLGRINLFELDLKSIEKRVSSHPWVHSVDIWKRFPQTVAISVKLREPRALLQRENGGMAYVDAEGKMFGQVSLAVQPDLPIFSGMERDEKIRQTALGLLAVWDKRSDLKNYPISSLAHDAERGFRMLLAYPLNRQKHAISPGNERVRTMVDLGLDVESEFDSQLNRLTRTLKYLSDNGIVARQIWADAGKKIVVKIARGS